jgi:hypothetical protein
VSKISKQNIINAITSHPKLLTFGIGLAITFVIGTAIGMVDHNQAFAAAHGDNNCMVSNPSGLCIGR